MTTEECDISIVLPVYNNQQAAQAAVTQVHAFLDRHFTTYEIILVDDGSHPSQQLKENDVPSACTLLRNPVNQGKGHAVKRGMAAARGRCRVFTDIDLPYDLSFILTASQLILSDSCHFVAGDRSHFESTQPQPPSISRQVASRFFRAAIATAVLGRAFDTQCGFKACSGTLADQLFPRLTIHRFAFDIEIFYLLRRQRVLTIFLPVHLVNSQESSVRLLSDGLRILIDAIGIPIRWSLVPPIRLPKTIPRGWMIRRTSQ